MKSTGKPTAITMCIGPTGDSSGVSPGECAVRMARAGTVVCLLFFSLVIVLLIVAIHSDALYVFHSEQEN